MPNGDLTGLTEVDLMQRDGEEAGRDYHFRPQTLMYSLNCLNKHTILIVTTKTITILFLKGDKKALEKGQIIGAGRCPVSPGAPW